MRHKRSNKTSRQDYGQLRDKEILISVIPTLGFRLKGLNGLHFNGHKWVLLVTVIGTMIALVSIPAFAHQEGGGGNLGSAPIGNSTFRVEFDDRDKAILATINQFTALTITLNTGLCALFGFLFYKSIDEKTFDWNEMQIYVMTFIGSIAFNIAFLYILQIQALTQVGASDEHMSITGVIAAIPPFIAISTSIAIISFAGALRSLLKRRSRAKPRQRVRFGLGPANTKRNQRIP